MSAGIVNYIRKVLFGIRWLTMSDRERYTYLWNRTRSSPGFRITPDTSRYASRVSFTIHSPALVTLDKAQASGDTGRRLYTNRHYRPVASPRLSQPTY